MSQHDFRVIPILRIFDLARATAFYVDYLGCRVDWTHRHAEGAPAYLQVSRGSLILHLTEHAGDCGPESTVLVWCTGLQALHHELSAKDTADAKPAIAIAPWNAKVMELTDPFGNRLRICEDLDGGN